MSESHLLNPTPARGTLDDEGYYRPSDYEMLTCWVDGFHRPGRGG